MLVHGPAWIAPAELVRCATLTCLQPAATTAHALPPLPPAPAVSTGLTPQVGTLELPPGIEGIVPTNMPLTGAKTCRLCLLARMQQRSGLEQASHWLEACCAAPCCGLTFSLSSSQTSACRLFSVSHQSFTRAPWSCRLLQATPPRCRRLRPWAQW